MKIIVTVQHAGHVHFFKHAIGELEAEGHEVFVFARENELSTELLERCDIDYELLAGASESLVSLARAQCMYEARLFGRAREIQPDVMTAIGGVAVSHVAALVDARSVVFYDTEHASIIRNLAFPFADVVCTPACFQDDLGDKHRRYDGYHELAYLHPDRFTPDPGVREAVGVGPDERLAVLRFGDWSSSHDVGESGFADPRDVVERLEDAGARVVVTAEGDAGADLSSYGVSLPAERHHDLLAAADLYVGEGATTAAECAVLGTPAVYVNSLPLGYLTELDREYGLVSTFVGESRHARALSEAARILAVDDDGRWQRRRAELLTDKRDVTDVVLDQIRRTVPVDA